MANHKSAQKRAIQNETRRLRNKAVKTRVRSVVRNLKASIAKESETSIDEMLRRVKSVIDNAAKKNVLHKKTASRKISRLSKIVNKIRN